MATVYTERAQTVLTKEQYELFLAIAQEQQKAISVLIREAIEDVYFSEQARRRQALAELIALDAPVGDWSEIEREIIEGAMT